MSIRRWLRLRRLRQMRREVQRERQFQKLFWEPFAPDPSAPLGVGKVDIRGAASRITVGTITRESFHNYERNARRMD